MSLVDEVRTALGDVAYRAISVERDAEHHGDPATAVTVVLDDGRSVVGTFTRQDRESFGGVRFQNRKDIPALMRSKVDSVLAGTAELS